MVRRGKRSEIWNIGREEAVFVDLTKIDLAGRMQKNKKMNFFTKNP